MNIKKIGEYENGLRLMIKGTDAVFLNSLRRAIAQHVPVLAIEDVSIYENNSVMFDELFAHRLGMLPIKTDSKTYKAKDKVKMVLEKEGPCIVYSKDIKSTDPKIEVIDKKIPLVKLKKGQRLKVEMNAVMNSGKEHAKWCPAIVGFQELPIVSVGKNCNLCEDCIKACPKNALEKKGQTIVLKNETDCVLCGACRDTCTKNALNLDYDEGSFIFNIESSGAMSEKEVLLRAVDAIKEKSDEFSSEMKKFK